ncbi:MAG: hypothetical protein ACLQNE_01410 [Thermoguttaceae bacterium]
MPIADIGLMPGWGQQIDALYRRIWWSVDEKRFLPGGAAIAGAIARDPTNTLVDGTPCPQVLQAGMVMGKVTAAGSYQGQYAPSILGLLTQGYGGATTTICVAAATAAEIVRRIGSTGTLNLTGPIAAGGTVRTIQAAYTAVNTGTGAVTLSAALGTAAVNAVNQVNTVAVTGTASAGTIQFTIEGTTTGTAAYSAVWATFLANIQAASDATFGTNAIVWGGTSLAGLTATFSGTGFAGRPVGAMTANVSALTGATGATVTVTTAGAQAVAGNAGDFEAGSLVQPADGSQAPRALITKQDGITVVDRLGNNATVEFPEATIGGAILAPQIINYPSDTVLQAWLKAQLKAVGLFLFSDDF